MYHVNADNRFPYWVCGGQQESGSACVASRGELGRDDRARLAHGRRARVRLRRSRSAAPRHLLRRQGREVRRAHRPDARSLADRAAVEAVSHRCARSRSPSITSTSAASTSDRTSSSRPTNGGQSWRAISPDLTRAHPGVPAVLGAFESDDPQHGAHRGVVYALAPSYVHAGTIWAGTDDGLVWITRDSRTRTGRTSRRRS